MADYRNVPDPVLLRERGLFVAEGRPIVSMLLERGAPRLVSLLVTPAALDALGGSNAIERAAGGDLPVYVAEKRAISALVGFDMTRGCLGLGRRPAVPPLDQLLERLAGAAQQVTSSPAGGLLVALEAVTNADNVGGVFRNAVAFGADAVVLSPTCCDPLYRKAIRVSMGASLRLPYTWLPGWPAELARLKGDGYDVVALTPAASAVEIDEVAASAGVDRPLVLLAGTEGAGLSAAALEQATVCARIPMAAGVDSLNIATAVGIALHRVFAAREI